MEYNYFSKNYIIFLGNLDLDFITNIEV